MAELKINASQELVYLSKYHLIGRKEDAVNTHINHPNVSRIHMLIEWSDNSWHVKDMSRNGVWLNNKQLDVDLEYPLSIGDTISLNATADFTFTVTNLDKPLDALVPDTKQTVHHNQLPKAIFLDELNLLPNETAPEIVLSYNTEEKRWVCENAEDMTSHPVSEGEKIYFANTQWKLVTGSDENDIATVALNQQEEVELKYIFRISQDEEHTGLKVKHNKTMIDMDVRCHHYLTALLARYKTDMLKQEADDGWVSIKKLSKDLGLSECHINIQIHRARKQLIEQFKRIGLVAPSLIERRTGYVRFTSNNFNIFKGSALEY
ncbi:FHA domain-containing protein [Pseudoalteromonas sp. MMG012]|uniref:FHA domain-containing protein n=1 Tax=Pseudoalteromonas sp. MMG012 TaxID=2822686 RepID=UPI001B39F938|nr:FHA domain-containing protein [Pseudoalteromonas sp. MMG012]MBQ4849528.1 FHA domain-containing protein [Pseudoalteromonas sp. MMG012]